MNGKCAPGCVFCIANRKGRGNYRGHRFYVARFPTYPRLRRSAMRQPQFGPNGDGSNPFESDCAFARRYPAIVHFLADRTWDDGTKREPGTISLSFSDGRFRVALNCKATGRVSFLSADSLGGLLEAANEGVEGASLEWRRQKPFGQSRR